MKRIIFICALCAWLCVSCATWQAYQNNATDEQKHEAMCKDARLAYELSAGKLAESFIQGEARAYWQAYKLGAQLALQAYCGGK